MYLDLTIIKKEVMNFKERKEVYGRSWRDEREGKIINLF